MGQAFDYHFENRKELSDFFTLRVTWLVREGFTEPRNKW